MAEAQTRYLHRTLAAGAGAEMQALFPEGDFFLRALTAMAEVRTDSPDLAAARVLRDSLDRPESVAVFGSGMVPEHGIFQAGWALSVAVDLARASGTPADVDDVRRRAAVIEGALRRQSQRLPGGISGPVLAFWSAVVRALDGRADLATGRPSGRRSWSARPGWSAYASSPAGRPGPGTSTRDRCCSVARPAPAR